MRYYAIRDRRTGFFLPASQRKRGYTHDDPTPFSDAPPRLFKSIRAAKVALNWWLTGRIHATRSGGSSYFGEYEYDEHINIEAQDDRKRENMEIVEVSMRFSTIQTNEQKCLAKAHSFGSYS